MTIPVCSPSRGGNVAVSLFDVSQPSLSTHFYSVLVSISVFMALSTIFHSMYFQSYFCLTGPFNYISLYKSLLKP